MKRKKARNPPASLPGDPGRVTQVHVSLIGTTSFPAVGAAMGARAQVHAIRMVRPPSGVGASKPAHTSGRYRGRSSAVNSHGMTQRYYT